MILSPPQVWPPMFSIQILYVICNSTLSPQFIIIYYSPMRPEQESYHLAVAEEQKPSGQQNGIKKARHIYLEEQNIYGRFVPYLLLKDQLESEIDSSGNTALHHMCSHNSPYIPLFLSTIPANDPILNRKSKLGHTPMDVAGLYCNRDYIEMLRDKGAVDNGNVDQWAIQGGLPSNWSGKVYPDKKPLIHWAAYNDMPEVLAEYAKEGIPVNQTDSNGYTPIDLAVLNKSYSSIRVLAEIGERPKQQLLKSTDSKSIGEYFARLEQSSGRKKLKKCLKFLSLILLLCLCLFLQLNPTSIGLTSVVLFLAAHLLIKRTPTAQYLDNSRRSEFTSELLFNKTINKTNHIAYLLLHVAYLAVAGYCLAMVEVSAHVQAVVAIVVGVSALAYGLHLGVQVYGIVKNLTYEEMFYSHKWAHLWDQIKFVQERKLLIRDYHNPEDKGPRSNLRHYLNY